MNLPEFTYLTFTNNGYTHYTNNLLQSIKNNNVDINLKIITLDKPSYDFFLDKHDNVNLFEKEDMSEELIEQSDNNFGNLMIVKFEKSLS